MSVAIAGQVLASKDRPCAGCGNTTGCYGCTVEPIYCRSSACSTCLESVTACRCPARRGPPSSDDRLPCPHCGAMQTDLWDYDWGSREAIITECSACNEPVDIIRSVYVRYEIRKGVDDLSSEKEGTDHAK